MAGQEGTELRELREQLKRRSLRKQTAQLGVQKTAKSIAAASCSRSLRRRTFTAYRRATPEPDDGLWKKS